MILLADWTKVGTKEQLEKDIGNGFKVLIGWLESKTDTIYCEEVPNWKVGTDQTQPNYKVYVWNRSGIREELALCLAKPVQTMKEGK